MLPQESVGLLAGAHAQTGVTPRHSQGLQVLVVVPSQNCSPVQQLDPHLVWFVLHVVVPVSGLLPPPASVPLTGWLLPQPANRSPNPAVSK